MDMETMDSSLSSGLLQEPCLKQMLCISVGLLAMVAIIYLLLIFLLSCFSRPICSPDDDDHDNQTSPGMTQSAKAWECDQDFEAANHIPVTIYGALPAESSPSSSSSSSNREICSICLAEFVCGEAVKILPRCKHMFHKDCINLWMPLHSLQCPVCREQAIEQDVETQS
ncbi:hypothetical protein Pfo_005837 [Paulownia fortunei]|nr:hypothetical protein Pfo_005837 [Paulownia fortunei]